MARISDPHDSEQTPPQQPSNGKTILLAEDDPFISRMYQTKLTASGFSVEIASTGRDAYEAITKTNPDLVMLDINLPELTGFEILTQLQQQGADFPMSKVIVLTNSANPADRKIAADLGIDYLVKADMTPHEVLNHINQKLGLPAV